MAEPNSSAELFGYGRTLVWNIFEGFRVVKAPQVLFLLTEAELLRWTVRFL